LQSLPRGNLPCGTVATTHLTRGRPDLPPDGNSLPILIGLLARLLAAADALRPRQRARAQWRRLMSMTHYMQLLAENQPWNLLIFMAVPIILAETVVVTELYILYTRNFSGIVRWVNKWAGILVGFYFAIVFVYLLVTAAVPLTKGGGWRGWIDVSAVGFYLSGVIPLLGIALLEVGVIARDRSPEQKLMIHASLVALFLVLGHVAMVFGMLDPALAGSTVVMPMHGH